MSKKKPGRFSAQSRHNDYGINNWFNKVGLTKQDLKVRLKTAFLEDHGCVSENKDAQDAFICKRFEIFVRYVQKNRKYFEENYADKLNQQP